jgi:hypothetical protein
MTRTHQPPAVPTQALQADAVYTGALGKTRRVEIGVTSATGRLFSALVHDRVNVSADPNLRQSLADGALTTVSDPWTGARYALALPVLVHDEALRLLALSLPESLRHQELHFRQLLLAEISTLREAIPSYVLNFKVVFGAEGLAKAEAEARALLGKAAAPDLAERARRELEERERLLAAEKQRLEAERLNLEALKARLAEQEAALRQGRVPPQQDNEPTSVVPREVFFQVARAARAEAEAVAPPREPSWGEHLGQGWELEEGKAPPAPSTPPPTPSAPPSQPSAPPSQPGAPVHRSASSELAVTDDLPRAFNRLRAGSRPYYHDLQQGQILLSYRLDERRMRAFQEQPPRLFLQYHDLEEFPLITLLLAVLGEDEVPTDDVYWPLDLRKPADLALMGQLQQRFQLRVALYGEDLKLRQVLQFQEPLELNARHLQALALQRLEQGQSLALEDALRRIEAPDYERLGSMRHNFQQQSFNDLGSPAQARLAAGIVGYWSGPETFRYLIENRSFPLAWFDVIQRRVLHAAQRFGVALSDDLRRLAVDLNLAQDELALARGLAATWAQTALGLGGVHNDMDALDTWHNWQDLIEALESMGASLDPELANLASAALKRAREYSEANQIPVELPPDVEEIVADPPTLDRAAARAPAPEPAASMPAIPGFAQVEALDRDAQRALLSDPDRRLAAAAALIARADHDAALEVLVLTEEMTDDEVETLSEIMSLFAPRMEETWLEAFTLESATITYLCGYALASIPSQRGLDALLDLAAAGSLDLSLFGEVMLAFGDGLRAALVERLRGEPAPEATHPLVSLLALWVDTHGSDTLDALRADLPNVAPLLA